MWSDNLCITFAAVRQTTVHNRVVYTLLYTYITKLDTYIDIWDARRLDLNKTINFGPIEMSLMYMSGADVWNVSNSAAPLGN